MSWTIQNKFPCPPHYQEFTYGEVVDVYNGRAVVQTLPAKDFLLKLGFDLVQEEESVSTPEVAKVVVPATSEPAIKPVVKPLTKPLGKSLPK